jgi:tetratricopeptide (TPR) repeat protein
MLTEEFLLALDARWNPSDPAASEAQLHALRAQRSVTLELRVLDVQIARLAGLQGDVARASALLDAVERSAGEEPPAELRARLLLERGRLLNSQDRPLEARPLFEQAHTLAVRARLDALDVDALHMVAITHLGDPEQALAWDLRALALAESSADARARQWLAVLYNNIGYSYDDQGDYARALELFEKALVLRIAAKKPGPTALAHYAVAHAQRELGRIDVARARLLPLLRELEASGAPAGHVLEELGECELAAGRSDAARPYFARAHAELSRDEWVREHEPSRLARLAQLAGTTATQP